MRFISYIIILSTLIITVKVSVLSNIRDNVISFLKISVDSDNDEHGPYHAKHTQKTNDKVENMARNRGRDRGSNKNDEYVYNNDNKFWFPKADEPQIEKEQFRIDSVLNSLRRKADSSSQTDIDTESSELSSSSLELKDWKSEWKEHWLQKKLEAVNSSAPTGDQVNMVAASKFYML